MKRGRVELAKGAVLPTARRPWDHATEKLSEAEHYLEQMRTAPTRAQFESSIAHVVDALQEFWVRLVDEAKNRHPVPKAFLDGLINERREDPLLLYLSQARHQSQHGRLELTWTEGSIQIAPGFNGHIKNLRLYQDGQFDVEATSMDPENPDVKLVHRPGEARLPQIYNKKYKQHFDPPTAHLGKPLPSASPVEVCAAGVAYYRDVLSRVHDQYNSQK